MSIQINWNPRSQAEMEQAMEEYFNTLAVEQAGQFNAMLAPAFVSCDHESKTLVVRMIVQPWMVNPAGLLHGGIAASMMDFVMGVLSRICAGGSMTPTVTMSVDYLRSLRAGDELMAQAWCQKCGRTLSYLTASGWNAQQPDKIAITATGTYYTGA